MVELLLFFDDFVCQGLNVESLDKWNKIDKRGVRPGREEEHRENDERDEHSAESKRGDERGSFAKIAFFPYVRKLCENCPVAPFFLKKAKECDKLENTRKGKRAHAGQRSTSNYTKLIFCIIKGSKNRF